jgi:DtxR family Mn-dependent transcriptional regulator
MLHKGIEDNICILLGHPKTCPHGKPIPAGTCCRDKKHRFQSVVMALSEMKKGQKGKIAYVHTSDREMLRKIMAMGALPGLAVTLLQQFPSPVFQIGESQFAIDKELADRIRVWVRDKDEH